MHPVISIIAGRPDGSRVDRGSSSTYTGTSAVHPPYIIVEMNLKGKILLRFERS